MKLKPIKPLKFKKLKRNKVNKNELKNINEMTLIEKAEELLNTFKKLKNGYEKSFIIDKQFILESFKYTTDMTLEEMENKLELIERNLKENNLIDKNETFSVLSALRQHYQNQIQIHEKFDKNKKVVNEDILIYSRWIEIIDSIKSEVN